MTTSNFAPTAEELRQRRFIVVFVSSLFATLAGAILLMILVTIQGSRHQTISHGSALLMIDATPGLALVASTYACAMLFYGNWVKAAIAFLVTVMLALTALYYLAIVPLY